VNHYFPSAPAKDLYVMAGIDGESIADAIQDEVRAEVCGGEDAFVSAVTEMIRNMQHSRFAQTAKSFIDKLSSEKGYLESLRTYWASRECSKENMPTTKDLVAKLKDTL
jgi:hypothetical protein